MAPLPVSKHARYNSLLFTFPILLRWVFRLRLLVSFFEPILKLLSCKPVSFDRHDFF